MADIAQILATGGTTIVAVGVGAGLTYWFGALNRRHQEAREDVTRWYEARREAYGALLMAASRASRHLTDSPGKLEQPSAELLDEISAAIGAVRLVGSPAVLVAADSLFAAFLQDLRAYGRTLMELAESPEDEGSRTEQLAKVRKAARMPAARKAFEEIAREDLGHSSASV